MGRANVAARATAGDVISGVVTVAAGWVAVMISPAAFITRAPVRATISDIGTCSAAAIGCAQWATYGNV